MEEVALPPITPASVYVPPAQIVAAEPAVAVAAGLIVNTIVLVTKPQGPAGSLVVKVNVTEPAAISAADGVYTAVAEVAELKVPVPEVVHVKLAALPPIEPAKVYVLPAQIVAAEPALAVAAALIVTVLVALAAAQPPDATIELVTV